MLLILGEGGQRQELEAAVPGLGLTGRAFLPGYRADVPAWMRAADLFLMPSLFEGLPISHLEAMGCGLPAVISEHVPSREIAEGCALVRPLDESAFAQAVADLLEDPAAYAAMSRAARETAERHGMARYTKDLLALYGELIG